MRIIVHHGSLSAPRAGHSNTQTRSSHCTRRPAAFSSTRRRRRRRSARIVPTHNHLSDPTRKLQTRPRSPANGRAPAGAPTCLRWPQGVLTLWARRLRPAGARSSHFRRCSESGAALTLIFAARALSPVFMVTHADASPRPRASVQASRREARTVCISAQPPRRGCAASRSAPVRVRTNRQGRGFPRAGPRKSRTPEHGEHLVARTPSRCGVRHGPYIMRPYARTARRP